MPVSSRAPVHLYEAISRVAGLGADKLETARRRWNEWQHEGYSSGGGDGMPRGKGDVPDVGSTLLRMEFDRVEVAHEAEDLWRQLPGMLNRFAQLAEMAAVTEPGEVRERTSLKPGAGSCHACGSWMDGDGEARIKAGLCPTHHRGWVRDRANGMSREAYVNKVRRSARTGTIEREWLDG